MDDPAYILVVDDEPGIRGLVATVLRDCGYSVRDAATGDEALHLAAGAKPRLAVVDYMMPGMSGIDTAVELRRLCGEDLPLVFMSAAAIPRRDLTRVDAYLWLSKPFELDDLIQAVDNATSRPQPQPLIQRDGERGWEAGPRNERAG